LDKHISDSKDKIIEFGSGILAWIDTDTNLMWEVKHQGNYKEEFFYDDIDKYIEELNEIEYAGFNDWRLPTICESLSLIDLYDDWEGEVDAEIFLDLETYFKMLREKREKATSEDNICYLKAPLDEFIVNGSYWTSSLDGGRAFFVNFKEDIFWMYKIYMRNNVICVRDLDSSKKRSCFFNDFKNTNLL